MADGVFAIAMTLLVLELSVPVVNSDLVGNLAYVGFLVVALLVAFVNALAAMVMFAAVVPAFVGFTAAGQWEAVTALPRTRTHRTRNHRRNGND